MWAVGCAPRSVPTTPPIPPVRPIQSPPRYIVPGRARLFPLAAGASHRSRRGNSAVRSHFAAPGRKLTVLDTLLGESRVHNATVLCGLELAPCFNQRGRKMDFDRLFGLVIGIATVVLTVTLVIMLLR